MLSNHCACGCRLVDLARKRQILAILAGKRLIITRNHLYYLQLTWTITARRSWTELRVPAQPSPAPSRTPSEILKLDEAPPETPVTQPGENVSKEGQQWHVRKDYDF